MTRLKACDVNGKERFAAEMGYGYLAGAGGVSARRRFKRVAVTFCATPAQTVPWRTTYVFHSTDKVKMKSLYLDGTMRRVMGTNN